MASTAPAQDRITHLLSEAVELIRSTEPDLAERLERGLRNGKIDAVLEHGLSSPHSAARQGALHFCIAVNKLDNDTVCHGIALQNDPDLEVRRSAQILAQRHGAINQESRNELVSTAFSSRGAAPKALAVLGGDVEYRDVVRILAALAPSSSPEMRCSAAISLFGRSLDRTIDESEKPLVVAALRSLIDDDEAVIRLVAFRIAGRLGQAAAVLIEPIKQRLALEGDEKAQGAACLALSMLETEHRFRYLEQALAINQPSVQAEAARSILRSVPAESLSVETLVTILDLYDGLHQVSQIERKALAKLIDRVYTGKIMNRLEEIDMRRNLDNPDNLPGKPRSPLAVILRVLNDLEEHKSK